MGACERTVARQGVARGRGVRARAVRRGRAARLAALPAAHAGPGRRRLPGQLHVPGRAVRVNQPVDRRRRQGGRRPDAHRPVAPVLGERHGAHRRAAARGGRGAGRRRERRHRARRGGHGVRPRARQRDERVGGPCGQRAGRQIRTRDVGPAECTQGAHGVRRGQPRGGASRRARGGRAPRRGQRAPRKRRSSDGMDVDAVAHIRRGRP